MAFVIDPSRNAASEVRRIAIEELTAAVARLDDPQRSSAEATVHSVRKHCKRVRALARLIRDDAEAEYRRINTAARDASAALSPLRDAHAVLATFDKLIAARPDLVPASGFGKVREALAARAGSLSGAADATAGFERAASLLGAAAARVDRWKLDLDLRDLVDGAADHQRLASRAFRRAQRDGSDEKLHEWRKRSKDQWYHTQLLCPLAPSVLQPTEKSLSNLCDALGDNNDLAVLSAALRDSTDELGGDQALAALPVIDQVRSEMIERCRSLAAVLAAEGHEQYRTRLRGYVKLRRALGPEQRVRGIDKIFDA